MNKGVHLIRNVNELKNTFTIKNTGLMFDGISLTGISREKNSYV
jgi:hypothetical protein